MKNNDNIGYTVIDVKEIQSNKNLRINQPFSHQLEAFDAMTKTLPTPIDGYRGTMLVLPTGGGKTFTSVNWVIKHILSKNIKVLWLAQSSYLIEQARDSFLQEMPNVTHRDKINMRIVSSDIKVHERKNGSHYYKLEVTLYDGNDPEWLKPHQDELLKYIWDDLGWPHEKELIVTN